MRFLLLLLVVSNLRAQPAPPSPGASAPTQMIADPLNDPAWRELFAQLAPQKTRRSKFEERRIFPFRNAPIVLQGEIRISPERGLSLSYLGDKPQVMIMDQKGVLLRDEHGRERTTPNDSRAEAATSALFQILRFDLPGLVQGFEIYGRRDGEAWTLGFSPREATLAGLIGSVIVQGENARVDRINLVKSEKQRIEISIRETQNDVTFTPEELKRFFR